MRSRWAAFAAAILVLSTSVAAKGVRTLTLDEAFARVNARHPDLARFQYLREGAQSDVDEATQRQPLRLALDVENVPGTGDSSGAEEAETTLSLASVLERSDKRDARLRVATARAQTLGSEQEARRLDLLAEVARRFLDLLAAQTLARIADAEVTQRESVVAAASQRVLAGASPDSVRLTAEAAVARARLQRERVRAETKSAAQRLAALWNERTVDFEHVTGDLLAIPTVPSLESLTALIDRNPQLRRFADEARLREARVQLARAAQVADIEWQFGVRRFESSDDWAAVAGFSMPFGTRARAEPRLRAAEAELAALSLERESEQLTLYGTLADAHAKFVTASSEAGLLRADLLPRLHEAERAAERAYRGGALSYLEWAQLQSDTTEAERQQIHAAIEAHRALIEIQRLTGQSFLAAVTTAYREIAP